jgi:ATP-dependent Lhr-like helicase
VRNFRFYAVFRTTMEYGVLRDSEKIGSISHPPPRGERFGLAGRTWEVVDIDEKALLVYAREVKGGVPARWRGSAGEVHTRILQRMRQVLVEDTVYSYLQPRARDRLQQARSLARRLGLNQRAVLDGGGDRLYVLPWRGSRETTTLRRALSIVLFGSPVSTRVAGRSPYYLTVKDPGVGERGLAGVLQEISAREYRMGDLLAPDEEPFRDKYDNFLPRDLLRLAYFHDRLDISSLKRPLSGLASA